MRKLIASLIMLVMAAGCTTAQKEEKPNPIKDIACSAGQAIGKGFALKIAEVGDCSNLDAINEDIYGVLVQVRVCEERPKAMMGFATMSTGGPICSSVGRVLFDSITAEKFERWGCTGAPIKAELYPKLDEVCEKIPF